MWYLFSLRMKLGGLGHPRNPILWGSVSLGFPGPGHRGEEGGEEREGESIQLCNGNLASSPTLSLMPVLESRVGNLFPPAGTLSYLHSPLLSRCSELMTQDT